MRKRPDLERTDKSAHPSEMKKAMQLNGICCPPENSTGVHHPGRFSPFSFLSFYLINVSFTSGILIPFILSPFMSTLCPCTSSHPIKQNLRKKKERKKLEK